MQLYICEKPSQAKDLARNLQINDRKDGYISSPKGDTIVTWCFGHLLELYAPNQYDPKYEKWNIEDLPIFPTIWKFSVKSSVGKQYKVVTDLIKKASEVVISTDFDREGEAIARTLLDRVKFNGKIRRLCLTALDDRSILKALTTIKDGKETENMYQAALTRSRADWLVGMNLSRLFSLIAQSSGSRDVVSIGRVQTPTVALVVERDNTIAQFKSIPFYEINVLLSGGAVSYLAKWKPKDDDLDSTGYMTDKNKAVSAMRTIQSCRPTVTRYECTVRKQSAPLPFDLTTLQQFANKKWGYSAKETLDIAQALYETHKATTYPRTDCRYIPESQFGEAYSIAQTLYRQDNSIQQMMNGADFGNMPSCYSTDKVTAHNAIIPTGAENFDITKLNEAERNVFVAVRRAFFAQFYPKAEYECAVIDLDANSEALCANSRVLMIKGWRDLYGDDAQFNNKEEEKENNQILDQKIPHARVGVQHAVKSAEIKNRETTPPQHFTEATLLSAMEHIAKYVKEEKWKKILKDTAGIGTPATRAEIISGAIDRKYLVRNGKTITSTLKAKNLITILPDEIKSAGMTAVWEQALEKIASGNMETNTFIASIEKLISSVIENYKDKSLKTNDDVVYKCSKCNGTMRRLKGKNGFFWSCTSCRETMSDIKGKPKPVTKK